MRTSFTGTLQRDLQSSNILDNLMALSAASELVGAEIIPHSEWCVSDTLFFKYIFLTLLFLSGILAALLG